MSHRISSRSTLPGLLFDAVEFGFFTKQSRCGPNPVSRFREALCAAGHAIRANEGASISVAVEVPHMLVTISAELFVHPSGDDGLVIGSGTAIRINPLRMLRTVMGEVAAGPVGDDGNDNVVGPTDERAAQLLVKQLACVRAAIDALATAVNSALPLSAEWVEERFWVRSVEVNVDHRCERARGAVRRLQRSALSGATRAAFDVYRAQATDEKGLPAVRWWRTKGGPVFKVYAKLDDLLRTEVGCLDLPAFKKALRRRPTSSHLDGAEATLLLMEAAEALHPLLEELVAHTEVEPVEEKTGLRLANYLTPWIMLSGGGRKAVGHSPGQRSVDDAHQALESLLTMGLCNAVGHPETSALRVMLDGLVSAGVLARSGRGAFYSLMPAWSAAASRVSELLLDRGSADATTLG